MTHSCQILMYVPQTLRVEEAYRRAVLPLAALLLALAFPPVFRDVQATAALPVVTPTAVRPPTSPAVLLSTRPTTGVTSITTAVVGRLLASPTFDY